MEKHQYGFAFAFSIVIFLGLISFISCIVAEFKRAKWKDMRMVGKLCYLPGSSAYGFGIVALICLSIAQIAGNLVICRISSYSREKGGSRKTQRPRTTTLLLVLSWVSFGIAAILLGVATSMSRKQPYGKGWSMGQCYLVKDGVFIGSGVLVMVNVGAIIGTAKMTIKKTKVDQDIEEHAQVG